MPPYSKVFLFRRLEKEWTYEGQRDISLHSDRTDVNGTFTRKKRATS